MAGGRHHLQLTEEGTEREQALAVALREMGDPLQSFDAFPHAPAVARKGGTRFAVLRLLFVGEERFGMAKPVQRVIADGHQRRAQHHRQREIVQRIFHHAQQVNDILHLSSLVKSSPADDVDRHAGGAQPPGIQRDFR
ncbi:MAG: hypothetical protein BWY76_02809 [bacterium ADurb.Bin429]|nr:MAG: hypothetical protein BWY76_02809 [bacterium ADurb.Bin429]